MNFLNNKKRGQITIYVILGIVIVVALAGAFVLKEYITKSNFEREAEKFNVGEDFIPVYNSYVNCIKDVTFDGIDTMASQGGYIEIPRYEYVVNPLIPFSNKLNIFENNNLEIAYWFYETGNGIKIEKIPTINDMQLSLSDYINDNLFVCTTNFTGYQGYNINNFESFETNVQILDSKIFVNVKSNFNVDYKEVNQKFDDIKVSLDSSFGYLYNKAVELYNKEKQENYFEEKTIDYLVVYDEIPYSGGSFSCNPRLWNKKNVEDDFKKILEVNTDAVGKINEKYYNIDLGDNNLDVSFVYRKEWPFFMEIDGGDEILREQSTFGENSQASKFLSALFCLNDYHFIYDIKYPILTILNKDDLDFQFVFEAIVDNNQPKENVLGGDYIPEVQNGFCNTKNNLLNLYAINYETQEYLDNVDVKISCVGNSCDVGETSLDNFGIYSLSEYVPSCVNADIKSYKENHNFGRLTLSTNEDISGFIYMKPYHNLKVDIKIVDNGIVRDSYDNEDVFVNFINEDDEFTQFLSEDSSINLIFGNYIIRSYIMRETNSPLKIEGGSIENCIEVPKENILGAFGAKDKKCFTNELDDVELDQVLVGGNEFEWNYDGQGSQITIYVTYDGIPSTVNEMGENYGRISNKERVRYPEVI